MGRGDKRTRKGKISVGSYGKTRPKKKNRVTAVAAPKTTESKSEAKETV